MLGFFLDAQMTRPVTPASPKRFLVPTAGGTKTGTVYLGDPYTASLVQQANVGDSTLALSDVSEFLSSGQVSVSGQTLTYTGITGLTLTGVTGITAPILVASVVTPLKQWVSTSQILIYPFGAGASLLQIALSSGMGFTFPGMPLILSQTSISTGATPLAIGVQVAVQAGTPQEFTSWSVQSSAMYQKAIGDNSPIGPGTFGIVASMSGYVNRQDQALPQRVRLLPLNRDISTPPEGFILGQYRWRDDTEINEQVIIPSNWSIDPTTLGNEKFVAGIGWGDDLKPVSLVQDADSIRLEIDRGFYFTGPNGYYLPANPQLDFISSLSTNLLLSQVPQPILPIYVGTYELDSQGFYEKAIEYKYVSAAAVTLGTDLPPYYFTLDRKNKKIMLNQAQSVTALYLGSLSGQPTDYFDVPIYPVDHVESVFIQHSDGTQLFASNWTFDQDLGQIVITSPTGTGTSIPGGLQGDIIMANCSPAVAVLYETGTVETRILDDVDLNPAFAGISGGFVYLQHSRQEAETLVLSADKPRIAIPATYASIVGLVAYGPVYFDGDYSLLQATAYSKVPGQVVQGAVLKVIADPTTFTGTINYLDPTTQTVEVTTGADGIANLVFRPQKNYGFYIPTSAAAGGLAGLATTTVANDTVVLPQPVPVSQLYAAAESQPWLVTLYTVLNNNPILGMVGADPTKGQVAWATTGTPGQANYRTNGQRDPYLSASNIQYPVKMLDANGRNYTDPLFTGNVVSLVYGASLPTGTSIGAYFVAFIQRTLLRVEAVDSNVESNSILLQIAPSPIVDDNVWLILNDSIHGILNQYRLGWSRTS